MNIEGLDVTETCIRMVERLSGKITVVSIRKDKITSCSISKTSKPILLIFAVMGLISGVFLVHPALGAFISAAFMLLFFLGRKLRLIIRSPTGKIEVVLRKTGVDDVITFIQELDI